MTGASGDIIGHKMRTQVDIPEDHLAALNAMAKAKEVSRAELVREAISEFVKLHDRPKTGEGLRGQRERGVTTLKTAWRIS